MPLVLIFTIYLTLLIGSLSSAKNPAQRFLSGREIVRMEHKLFMMINGERRARGLQPLVLDPKVQMVVKVYTKDIASRNVLSHSTRNEPEMTERLKKANIIYKIVGENITSNNGADNPLKTAMESWMNSPEQFENIINTEYNRSAIGIAQGRDGTFYFAQIFIKK